jgi:hypothetical protein
MNLTHGAAWKTWAQYQNAQKISYLSGVWKVPDPPSSVSTQILYYWNGVEPDDQSAVLQPVLQFGQTPAGGGNYWAIASWYVSSSNGVVVTGLVDCDVGDAILGQLTFLNNGSWVTNGTNVKNGKSAYFVYTPTEVYDYAYEVLEAYNVDNQCNLYPPSGVVHFTDIVVQSNGKTVTPTWQPMVKNNQCNEQTKVLSATAVDIVFNTK